MTRHPSSFRSAIAICIVLDFLVATSQARAGLPETFTGPSGMTGILHPPLVGTHPRAAVLIVHDALGLDQRSHRYIVQLNAAGLLVLEVELRANPLDGLAEPLPGETEAAELVAQAAAALGRDPRVDPMLIGAIGFGIGARAVALAPPTEDGRAAFAARLLLYPGCESLNKLVRASPHAAEIIGSPVLILHGEDDPANTSAECDELGATLSSGAPTSRISYSGATYAWDLPQTTGSGYATQPWPGRHGWIPVQSWPELTELTAARAAAFLAYALHMAAARSD